MYNRLSPEEAMDYESLKVALLERYDFTESRLIVDFTKVLRQSRFSILTTTLLSN